MTSHRILAAALLAGGVAVAGLGLGAGTAQAGFAGAPAIPRPKPCCPLPVVAGRLAQSTQRGICHDYTMRDNQVAEGIGCPLPQFQWFQCPPGTTPDSQMPLIPNR
jgi:hypothetical protein